jgi:ATP-dependent Lhr-like helicase
MTMTMSSPTSSSESAAFSRLHPALQRWVFDHGWTTLHDAQEQAIEPILAGEVDVVISAATAAGKTEAAFLPICSALALAQAAAANPEPEDPWTKYDPWANPAPPTATGIQVLYLSPLKALINDQYDRLDQICETVDIPVHRWHGDVSNDAKRRAREHPSGVLLITPESLEASFVNRGSTMSTFLAGVSYIVVDELHSFLSSPRGAQLQSLMNRVELAIRRRPPRIGLSATLGDLAVAASFLRPTAPETVRVIDASGDRMNLQMQVRGYRATPPQLTDKAAAQVEAAGGIVTIDEVSGGEQLEIADHLFKTLRNTDNLVFANSRGLVETYADLLARRCERDNLPVQFFPHHGSLSKELRESVEADLKDNAKRVTAVCTSTLEMGIDIGSVASVAQVGPPPSVASLRQRLGRSGRRDEPAVLRVYVSEPEIDDRTSRQDELREGLVQTVAMVRLLLAHWIEAPDDPGLNLSTLVQQTLSTIAQHGGATAKELHRALCGPGPFELVSPNRYLRLLNAMAAADLVAQAGDGTLLHGGVGERMVNHYSFYPAFQTPEEWTLIADGRRLGTLPLTQPLFVDGLMIFAGRRWKITGVDPEAKVVELTRAAGGAPPAWHGESALVSDRVRAEMAAVYADDDEPAWLDREAKKLLAEGRDAWRRLSLATTTVHRDGTGCLVFPWLGDRAMQTAGFQLMREGIVTMADGCALEVHDISVGELREVAARLAAVGPVDALELARDLANPPVEKWDWILDPELAAEATAARSLDPIGAHQILTSIADDLGADQAADPPAAEFIVSTTTEQKGQALEGTTFCVVDVETTGFSPRLGDRVVEIAAVRVTADGVALDRWATLVDPARDIGATHIHGITAGDVLGAPTFAQIVGDLFERMAGAVVVAHNKRFDLEFLTAEFERAGVTFEPWPSICTLGLGAQLQPGIPMRRLSDCCGRFGIALDGAHSALVDADATAQLLAAYIRLGRQHGLTRVDQLGLAPTDFPALPAVPSSGRVQQRGAGGARVEQQATYLAGLVGRLGDLDVADPDIAGYLDILDRALEDRRLTEDEARALQETAAAWGLSGASVRDAHSRYYDALLGAALADGMITELEQADLDTVALLLGVDQETHQPVGASPPQHGADLAGQSICFTGALVGKLNGSAITREQAQAMAQHAGLVIKANVSKGLDLLVVADPDSQSGKAKKARDLGTRVMGEMVFWRAIGAPVE